ncbi:MAG: hypothetical protein E6J90_45085 [Deltaproteobacteria bacterium]|nr:MAG: hypothetical protein E6J90_45085 [Deltaproteobacteria bacterium]TMQ08565.1 MAG: hypothetical protein E6J91_32800 [Deltaproteobacteria bacterium]
MADWIGMWKFPWRPVAPALAALAAALVAACIYDPGQRCGPAMTFVEAANACVCDGNAVPVTGGCRACAADEIVAAGTCGCPTGQAKNAANICEVITALGKPCDTATTPCSDERYSYCAVRGAGTAGTCTSACTSHADCDAAYTCATWEAQPYCRTFAGFGNACASSDDCSGDARFCDTFVTHVCDVAGCSLTLNDCPRGLVCCDFSRYALGTLCAEACL